MEPAENRNRDDLAVDVVSGGFRPLRHLLSDPLVRPGFVEVADVLDDHSPEMLVAQYEDVVETFAPNAAEESLADCVADRGLRGRVQYVDVGALGDAVELASVPLAEFAVIVPDDVLPRRPTFGTMRSLAATPLPPSAAAPVPLANGLPRAGNFSEPATRVPGDAQRVGDV